MTVGDVIKELNGIKHVREVIARAECRTLSIGSDTEPLVIEKSVISTIQKLMVNYESYLLGMDVIE